MKNIIKNKKHKAILKKGYQQKQLESFSWKKQQLFTKNNFLNCHFTEKLAITKMGLNTRRKKEKKNLVHNCFSFKLLSKKHIESFPSKL